MSVQQDRFTFFGVLAAVVIVVLGYLQLSQLYPVAGRGDDSAHDTPNDHEVDQPGAVPREGESQP